MSAESSTPSTRPGRGPVRSFERVLAPDLARGAMLLLISLANAAGYFLGGAPGVEAAPRGFERFYNVFMVEFVHARVFPLFAIMFGYGLVQLARRQEQAGATSREVRRVLMRRNAWLVAFGAVHGILLYSGDFLGAYGLIGIAFTWLLLQRSGRVHRLAPWYLAVGGLYVLALAGIVGIGLVTGSGGTAGISITPFPSARSDSYGASVIDRLTEWPVHTATLLPMMLIVWVGAWAARHRVLEEPARHMRLLKWSAVGGLVVAVTAGLPMALLSGGFLSTDAETAGSIRMLYEASGLFGGIGYVAVFGLLASALTRHANPHFAVAAISALGQRSLTGYLFQSVAWLVLAMPFTLALAEKAVSPLLISLVCAVAVWVATVAAAYFMDRCSYRGPAEVLLRRLTYGRR